MESKDPKQTLKDDLIRLLEEKRREELLSMSMPPERATEYAEILDAVRTCLDTQKTIEDNESKTLDDVLDLFRIDTTSTIYGALNGLAAAPARGVPKQELKQRVELLEFMQNSMAAIAWLDEMRPYIHKEYEKPEYADVTPQDLYMSMKDPFQEDGIFFKLYYTSWKTFLDDNPGLFKNDTDGKTENHLAMIKPASVMIKRPDYFWYPLDKINSSKGFWDEAIDGKLTPFDVRNKTDKKKKVPIDDRAIIIGVDFDNLPENMQMSKKLDSYDKLVYNAIATLWAANADDQENCFDNPDTKMFTLTNIYDAMGGTSKPNPDMLDKINNSVTKMSSTKIIINNKEQAKNYNYDDFSYDSWLLPIERVTHTINGVTANAVIHTFREPPLMTFARNQKQYTRFPLVVLQAPISKTPENLRIQNYLIERISHARNSGRNWDRKILFETICDHCQVTGKQKQRLPEKVERYMKHFVKVKFIDKYRNTADSITVYFADDDGQKIGN